MKITEIKPEFVFVQLAKGVRMLCVDFKKVELIELSGVTIEYTQRLITSPDAKFYSIVEEG